MFDLKEFRAFVGEALRIVVISLLIILPIRYFVTQPFFVRGASMEPSFLDGDYLIIDELSYRFYEPRRGDTVVFRFPGDPSQFYIKRVIGLPGETLQIHDGSVYIQRQSDAQPWKLSEPYLGDLQTFGELTARIDDNKLFVMGDNRAASYDSRHWGPLPLNAVIGRAWARPWPIEEFGSVNEVQYSEPAL
ncbi:MAG: signal peptidase I [Candidatus Spechtbacteria bacterium]|nr:signal peptidase I [Candidatus Spechtbacteria bacterium]